MEINECFKFLNDNYGNLLSAIATLIGSIIYIIVTWIIIYLEKKARRTQEAPHIEIFLRREKSWGSILELVVKNIGYSGASNIKLTTDKDFILLDNNEKYTLKNLGFFKNGISFLPVNGEVFNHFTILSTNYEEKIKWKAKIHCEYKDKYGKLIKEDFLLDLSSFQDTFLPSEEPIYKIEKHLDKISRNLEKISKGFSNSSIITQTKEEFISEQKEKYKDNSEIIEKTRIAREKYNNLKSKK